MHRLNPLDTAFVSFETEGAPLHVAATLLLDPPAGQDHDSPQRAYGEIRELIEQRLHLVPLMRQRIVEAPLGIAPPVRVDDPNFDLDNHLTRAALPSPGGTSELEHFIGRIMSRPMFLDRPLWEMIVIEGVEGGRTALMARFHHAMIDGVSGANILAHFFDLAPEPQETKELPTFAPGPLPTGASVLSDLTGAIARHPLSIAESFARTVSSLFKVVEHNRTLPEGETHPTSLLAAPKTSINGTISAQRKYAAVTLSFEDVQRVGSTFGASVTNVVMATVAEGLNRLFAGRGEQIDRDLVAMVPISTRPVNETDKFDNQISAMIVSLATLTADPVTRLQLISASSKAAKQQDQVLGTQIATDITRLFPPVIANLVTRAAQNSHVFDKIPPVSNVLVSSVAGPDFPLWCAGRRIAGLYPTGPIAATIGLNVTAFRYLGNLYVGVLSCQRLVPDLCQFAQYLSDAFTELVKAANDASGSLDATESA